MEFFKIFDRTKVGFAKQQRSGKKRGYPNSLKRDAVSLLQYYPAQTLCEELDISITSLRVWQKGFEPSDSKQPTFVPVTLSDTDSVVPPRSDTQIRLKLPHQLELILPIYPIIDTTKLICSLIREFGQCSI